LYFNLENLKVLLFKNIAPISID